MLQCDFLLELSQEQEIPEEACTLHNIYLLETRAGARWSLANDAGMPVREVSTSELEAVSAAQLYMKASAFALVCANLSRRSLAEIIMLLEFSVFTLHTQ